jgi:outer membrane immunogenic protein
MKKLLVAGIAAATFCGAPALAADLPTKAPVYKAVPAIAPLFDWSGFYLGGHLGYLWGRTRVEEDGVVTEPGAKTNGVIGGVLAGANWQSGPLVVGLEGDFGWTNAHGVGVSMTPTESPNTYDANWTSHVRVRGGYASNNWLFFVAGGLAIADLDFHEGGIPQRRGGNYVGWSIGGGVDFAFTHNLVGRIEYLYDDFGHKDYTGIFGDPYRVSLTGQTLRAALTWKFDPIGKAPVSAKY